MEENNNKILEGEIVETNQTNNLPDEDNVATAEEMEAEARRSAAKRAHNKEKKQHEDDSIGLNDYNMPDSQIDPYTEPDPEVPWVKYTESEFLSRGCSGCPKSYEPISETERNICGKVTSCNWLSGIRQPSERPFDIVEVRFKNNRKEFFRLPDRLEVVEGDVVAVEGMPGHDVGIVTLTGEMCRIQMKKRNIDPASASVRKLFRRAKANDIEKWAETIKEEHEALLKTRRIAADLGLEMKVNDVEFQGDRSKAIFYYTADDRVDFRTLIKVLAEEFKVRVEMKQIGVRQEAGKVGGIGTCGRELCCSTWLTNFKSVTTGAAKTQQILPNPQKLAGQCGKLKCCLNFEYEVYVDALKKFPPANTPIRFKKGLALYKKTDVFRGIMWYAYEGENDLYAIPAESVKEIIEMNRNQKYPEKLEDFQVELMSTASLAQETSNDEFEQELRRLAESGDGVVREEEKRPSRHEGKQGNRNGGDRRNNRNGGDKNRGENTEHKGQHSKSDRQDNRHPRGKRDNHKPSRNNKPQQ